MKAILILGLALVTFCAVYMGIDALFGEKKTRVSDKEAVTAASPAIVADAAANGGSKRSDATAEGYDEFQGNGKHIDRISAVYPDVVVHNELPTRIRIGNPDGECSFVSQYEDRFQWPAGSDHEYKNPWTPVSQAVKECGEAYERTGPHERTPLPQLYNTPETWCKTSGVHCTDDEFAKAISDWTLIWNASPEWLRRRCSSVHTLHPLVKCVLDKTLDALNKDTTMVPLWEPLNRLQN